MIKLLNYDNDCVFVHAGDKTLKTTKAFTHGTIVFDEKARTATFGQTDAVALPENLPLKEDAVLNFQLVAPDGSLRKQVRSGVLNANEKQPGTLRIPGTAKSGRRYAIKEGWGNAIYKYRAYFTHPGLDTDGELPEWLKGSIGRQKDYWNHLAWLCREARRKCSPVPTEEIVAFVQQTVLPEIDAFNDALGRSKDKMKHPVKLKQEAPGLDSLWHFVGDLRTRIEKGHPVPDGLLEKVTAFAQQYKPDYTPLNEFLNHFTEISEREAAAYKLRRFEIRPTIMAFKAVLARRKKNKSPWSKGWPLIKYPENQKADYWGLHYYLNKAAVDASRLESGANVGGLSFGPALEPDVTGHANLHGDAAKRKMREAQISILGPNREPWRFRFGVLQHRPLPENSHIKEWKLLFKEGALWLDLVIELQRPLPTDGGFVAGLEIGWRRTEEGIRFGTLYEPVHSTIRELTINLQRSPKDQGSRVPFCIDMGLNRWEKRNIAQLFLKRKPGEELQFSKLSDSIRQVASLFPEWKPGDTIPNMLGVKSALQNRLAYVMNTAKIQLRKHLGEQTPAWLDKAWLDKAGRYELRRLQKKELKDDAEAQAILNTWRTNDEAINKLIRFYAARSTRRMEYGQIQVAHDVCRYLRDKGVSRLVVESKFVAKVAQQQDNYDPVALQRSQKYRQFAAPAKFLEKLKNTAMKYGIVIRHHTALNISGICHYCDHLNPPTEKESYQCENCKRVVKQDPNAAINLARFGSDPELAEMAVLAGRVA